MTLQMIGSERAPGIRASRRLAMPDMAALGNPTIDFIALFGLDRPSPDRRLVCRWRRDSDGRIACFWEPDIVLNPLR